MDSVRPWILKQVREGLLANVKTGGTEAGGSLLPMEPFRGQKVQFIRFLSTHEWGAQQPVWAEASDRQVTVLVYLSPEIVGQFEQDQKADQRPFGRLGFPSFTLGGCRWAFDRPPPPKNGPLRNRQLCIRVVPDLPNKLFRIGSTAAFPFPVWPPSPKSSSDTLPSPPKLLQLAHALQDHEPWILLNKQLHVTNDPRLTVTGNPSTDKTQEGEDHQDSNPSVQISIWHTGPSKRPRTLKARKMQKNGAGSKTAMYRMPEQHAVPASSNPTSAPTREGPRPSPPSPGRYQPGYRPPLAARQSSFLSSQSTARHEARQGLIAGSVSRPGREPGPAGQAPPAAPAGALACRTPSLVRPVDRPPDRPTQEVQMRDPRHLETRPPPDPPAPRDVDLIPPTLVHTAAGPDSMLTDPALDVRRPDTPGSAEAGRPFSGGPAEGRRAERGSRRRGPSPAHHAGLFTVRFSHPLPPGPSIPRSPPAQPFFVALKGPHLDKYFNARWPLHACPYPPLA